MSKPITAHALEMYNIVDEHLNQNPSIDRRVFLASGRGLVKIRQDVPKLLVYWNNHDKEGVTNRVKPKDFEAALRHLRNNLDDAAAENASVSI